MTHIQPQVATGALGSVASTSRPGEGGIATKKPHARREGVNTRTTDRQKIRNFWIRRI